MKCHRCNKDLEKEDIYYCEIFRIREYKLLPNDKRSSEPLKTEENYACKECVKK